MAAAQRSAAQRALTGPARSWFISQSRNQRSQRLSPVRKLVLGVEWQFGARQACRHIEKMRVITETTTASGRVYDRPVPPTLGQDRLGIVAAAQQHQHAIV